MIELPYGSKPMQIKDPPNLKAVVLPNDKPGMPDFQAELRKVLDNPIGQKPLREMSKNAKKVAVIISDPARRFPKTETFNVVREYLPQPDSDITIIIAYAKHPVLPPERWGLSDEIIKRYKIINHTCNDLGAMKKIGTTPHRLKDFYIDYIWDEIKRSLKHALPTLGRFLQNLFTLDFKALRQMIRLGIIGRLLFAFLASRKKMVFINKAVAEADLVIGLGQIKPHYFAGYSGGAKSILPGVAHIATIGPNHFMKTHPKAKLGIIEENVVRQDMEAAAALVPNFFIVNVVVSSKGEPVKVVAGDYIKAHREGVKTAREMFEVKFPARSAEIVIVSDSLPVTMNIYQTTKTIAPAAIIVKPGGVIIAVAECPDGVGGALVINEVIYQLGLTRYLPENVDCLLVSGLADKDVCTTFCRPAHTVEEALAFAFKKCGSKAEVVVIPRATFIVPISG
jgi:nickel-dependent lactate racemase